MPKVNIDYSKTIIYKIVCNDLNITDCYIGQTTEFAKRKSCHKRDCNTEHREGYKYKIYKFIRENGGWDNWSMIEIEKYSCSDGNEARARERHWFETLQATLNTDHPNRGNKESSKASHDKYKEARNEKNRQYSQDNKDKRKRMNKAGTFTMP